MAKTSFLPFSQNDYEIIQREILYQGVFRMARYRVKFRLFQGGWSKEVLREIMERKSAVGVLPYDPHLDQIVLIEQFRTGAIANPESPWLLEVVAGVIDGDESLENVATRESEEEAGCTILDLYKITDFFVSPGGSNEYFTLFCGCIDSRDRGGIHGLEHEDENIRAFTISVDEAIVMLQEGKIKTSPAIIAIQWLQLNREWLKQLWQTK